MKTTLTRLFTVMLLIMVSLGAKADVKVLFGEKGTELQPAKDGTITLGQKELTGGTIIISQEEQKDGTTKVTFAVTPDKNYKLAENGLEVYAVIPTDISPTRGLEVSTTLTLKSEDYKDEASKRTYTTTIDSKLALWVKSADFQQQKRDDAKAVANYTFYVINNNGKQSVKATASVESTSTVLDAFKATTTSVLSPLIASDDDYYFYDTEAEATAATGFTSEGGNGTSTIATVDADNDKNIYVRYYYNNDSSPIDLSGSIQYNIMIGGRYLVFNQSRTQRPETIQEGAVTEEMLQSTSVTNVNINGRAQNIYFRWKFTGNDPYNITVATCYDPGDKFLWGKMGSTGSATTMWVNNGFTGDALLGSIQQTNIYKNNKNETNLASFILLPHSSGSDFVLMAATTSYQPNNSGQYAYQRNASTANPSTNAHYQAPYFLFSTAANAQMVSITPIGKCESPTITYDNSTGTVSIESATPGAIVYYTVNGSTDPSSSATRYTAPFSISGTTTIKAIAIRTGVNNSEVVTQTIEKLVSPSISFDDATQKVIITTISEVDGATNVYSTDENAPTPSSTAYSDGISLTETSTVNAMTVKDGYINSDPVSLTVEKLASKPTITISGSTVTMSCSDPDATITIYYVTDGTTPTQTSTPYNGPFTLEGNQLFTIKAIATKTGYLNSDVEEEVIDNRTTISAPTITYTGNTVTITAGDIGDEIYYTTDGTTPTTSTATHFTTSGTFNLDYGNTYTIKAIAYNGILSSSVATETIDLTNVGYAGIYYLQNNVNVNGTYYMYPVGGESALVTTATKTDQDAIWKIEIVGDYYRIKHYKDGKYLVAKDVVDGTMPDTETVSLVDTESPGENALFEITRKSGDESNIMEQILLIRPKAAPTNSEHKYLNPRGGNNGTNKIGLWDDTGSSEWKLAIVPAKPTFKVDDIKVTISSDLGDVYYTIDGSTPTSSSTKGKSVTLKYGPQYTVKAICIYHDEISNEDWTSEVATSSSIQVKLLNPIFTRSGSNVIISNSQASGVTFRYTMSDNGTDPENPDPAGAGTNYTSALPLTVNARNVFKAIAYNTVDGRTYTSSDVITFVVDLRDATTISSLSDIDSATGSYKLSSGFSATGTPKEGDVEIGTSTNPFKGTIDGNLVEFELNSPLFDYVQDATIKNVIISKATISTSGNAGAIANNALGATRIYNCGINSGSVSGSNYVGGLVGLLDGRSRVINCFSYATIDGGTHRAGIVGYNNYVSTKSDVRTMVMNCMFYGNISTEGATQIAPVYGGLNISNVGSDGLNNYDYFRFNSTYVSSITVYNCALGAEDRYLDRFEFFRHTLNSNRELAAWYVTGNPDDGKGAANIMAKWVVDKSIAPYPILKAQGSYPSVINHDAAHAEEIDADNEHRNEGRRLGSLSVSVSLGSGYPTGASITKSSITLNITDKDTEHYDFNYRKVQLPYYNEVGTGNCTYNKVVTGWKMTVSGGTTNFTTGTDAPAYNFTDRKCTEKDNYNTSGRIFSQGAYYEVPDGVTAITIEPYWADCVYLANASLDVNYTTGYIENNLVAHYTNGTKYSINGSNQVVYTTFDNARKNLNPTSGNNVYDKAIVLVGNYHKDFDTTPFGGNNVYPMTIMSADLNNDNEPDYCFFYAHNAQRNVTPIRFDFINLPAISMALKPTGATAYKQAGVFYPKGWFEITNTALIRFGQFEYGRSNVKTISAPLILMGGIYEQFLSCREADAGNTPYIHIGGNAWFNEFNNGCHTRASNKTPKNPISVSGGDYNKFYLSGAYRPEVNPDAENAECYIDGGRFGEVAGAGMQKIDGSVTWIINGADIENFYGGGINPAKPITGNLSTTITDSWVTNFYGGPKFGDMATGKTVTTNATGCHFGNYFGAGYGGNAFNRDGPVDATHDNTNNVSESIWNGYITSNYGRAYNSGKGGISTSFDYEYLIHSNTTSKVARFFVNYASLSLASTRNVTSTLTGCTISHNFYGGGSLGSVNGDVTSTLTNCTVEGSVFGAGFSATTPTIDVMNNSNFVVAPSYDYNAGVFNDGQVKYPATVKYTWTNDHGSTSSPFTDDEVTGEHWIYTATQLSDLGRVTGTVKLNIEGNTLIKGYELDDEGEITTKQTGGVFGGGDASGVTGSTEVTANASGQKTEGYNVHNVYGGGNSAPVSGNTVVTIKGNTVVNDNVYGGGNEGPVTGSTTVNIEQ